MNNDLLSKLATYTGVAVLAIVLVIADIFLQGVIFSHLWLWYIVPLGLPVVGYLHAFMLVMMLRIMTFRPADEPRKPSVKKFCTAVGAWLTALLIGYTGSFFV